MNTEKKYQKTAAWQLLCALYDKTWKICTLILGSCGKLERLPKVT